MSEDELTCQELVEIVTDYLEERLSGRDHYRFEEHLGRCPGCAAYLEQMRITIRLTGVLRDAHISPRVLEVFRAWKDA